MNTPKTDTQQSHTPTPWAVEGWLIVKDKGVRYSIADVMTTANLNDSEKEANAAFIVRACNSHDDLVAAAELLLQQYDSSGDFTMGGNLTNEPFLLFRAALKRAKGDT